MKAIARSVVIVLGVFLFAQSALADEPLYEGLGTTGRKVTAFVMGAFFGGVAGGLFALYEGSLTPGYFTMAKSIEIVVMVTLGGLGSISGAILAAIVLTYLPELLRDPPSLGIGGWAAAVVLCAIIFGVARFRRTKWLGPVLTILIGCVLWEVIRSVAIWQGVRLSEFRMIIYSLALVLMMLLRPQGLLGGRELWPKRLGNAGRLPTPTEDRQDDQRTAIA
jgi:branched-chain amino acid transport system permease protein